MGIISVNSLIILLSVIITIGFAKYEVELERIIPYVEPDIFLDLGTLRVRKFNRSTYVINGTYHLKHALDEETTITLIANNMQGGEYRKLAEKTIKDPCKEVVMTAKSKPYYEDVNLNANMPPFGTCPFPAGDYYIKNYYIVDKGIIPETVPGGEKYRIDIIYKLGDDPKPVGGYRLFLKLTKQLM